MRFLWGLITVLIVCGFSAAGAEERPDRAEDARPTVFLLAVPLSGPLAEYGRQARQGAELALSIWGGGYKMEILDESRPEAGEEIDLSETAAVLGYFTESGFTADAPRYIYLRKPALLPYLASAEAAGRAPGLFFRLMPTYTEQGRFLALEILNMSRRPGRILIIQGADPSQGALTGALTETLVNPKASPEPETGPRAGRPETLRPLEAKAQAATISLSQALEPEGLAHFGRYKPDLVILALDLSEAARLAPRLAEAGYEKTPLWGGAALGFREAGAAFTSLNLNLSLCLPTVNLADRTRPAVRDFIRAYIDAYRVYPTWIAALAFDGLNMAIKAASSAADAQGFLEFLAGRSHHSLAAYELTAEGGRPPLAFMPVTPDNLVFLPY